MLENDQSAMYNLCRRAYCCARMQSLRINYYVLRGTGKILVNGVRNAAMLENVLKIKIVLIFFPTANRHVNICTL